MKEKKNSIMEILDLKREIMATGGTMIQRRISKKMITSGEIIIFTIPMKEAMAIKDRSG